MKIWALIILLFFLGSCTDDRDWVTLQKEAAKFAEEGNFEEAATLAQKSLAQAKSALGPSHEDIAHVHNTLAMIAYGKKDYTQAEAHHLLALSIQEQMLDENDLEIGRTLTYLGDFFLIQRSLKKALDMHERAHKVLVANMGEKHPDVGRSLNNLARIYSAQNRLREAADYHTQSLAILEPALGSDHPEVEMVVDNLTALYSDIVPQNRSPEITEKTLQNK